MSDPEDNVVSIGFGEGSSVGQVRQEASRAVMDATAFALVTISPSSKRLMFHGFADISEKIQLVGILEHLKLDLIATQ